MGERHDDKIKYYFSADGGERKEVDRQQAGRGDDDRDESGIYQWGRMTMKSGLGSITFNGTSTQYQGVGFVAPVSEMDSGTKQLIMSSGKISGKIWRNI